MTCNEVCARLDDYIDGLMLENERIELESHIEKCEACAKELAQLKLVLKMLKQVAKNDGNKMPNYLHQKLCDIPNTHKVKKMNVKLWGTLAATIICVFVLTLNHPTGPSLKQELAQESVPKAVMPEMSTDENRMGTLEENSMQKSEEKVAEEPLQERVEMTEYTDMLGNEIYLEINADPMIYTNTIVEEVQSLKMEVVASEPGRVQLIGVDEKSLALIIERLGKIGRITYQPERFVDSTLTIYLIEE